MADQGRWFRVANFDKFQHYKDRNPPWIKLHNTLTDHYEFGLLRDASKAHLMMIWLLASRHENYLPWDAKWIAARIQATDKVRLDELATHGFIESITSCKQCASKMLASCEHFALLDRGETEDRNQTETDFHARGIVKPWGDEDFESWWKILPPKMQVGKLGAREEWNRLVKARKLPETAMLILAVHQQRGSDRWQRGFITNAKTWLHNGRWSDAVVKDAGEEWFAQRKAEEEAQYASPDDSGI